MAVCAVALGALRRRPRPGPALARPAAPAAWAARSRPACCPTSTFRSAHGRTRRSTGATPRRRRRFLAVVTRRDFWDRAGSRARPTSCRSWPTSCEASGGDRLASARAAGAARRSSLGRRRRLPVAAAAAGDGRPTWPRWPCHGSRTDIFIWHRYYIPSYLMAACLAAFGARRGSSRAFPRLAPAGPARCPRGAAAGWRAVRSQPLPDRRGLQPHAALDAAARRATWPPPTTTSSSCSCISTWSRACVPTSTSSCRASASADLPPLSFDPDTDPLFFTHHPNWSIPSSRSCPRGLVFRTVRAGRPLPPAAPIREHGSTESSIRAVPKDYLTQNLIGQFHYMLGDTLRAPRLAAGPARVPARAGGLARQRRALLQPRAHLRRNGLYDEALARLPALRRDQPAPHREPQPRRGRRQGARGGAGGRRRARRSSATPRLAWRASLPERPSTTFASPRSSRAQARGSPRAGIGFVPRWPPPADDRAVPRRPPAPLFRESARPRSRRPGAVAA